MNLTRLQSFRADKTALCLTPDAMQRLFGFFRHHFGIDFQSADVDISTAIREACGARIARQFDAINLRRAHGTPAEFETASAELYEFVATMPLLGIVHSVKRTFITDVAAYASALVHHLSLTGPILDVGCHVGYHALWLAAEHGNHVRGIDTSHAALRFARAKAKTLDLPATFDAGPLADGKPLGGYDLVLASDGPLTFSAANLAEVQPLLADGGLLVLVEDAMPESSSAFEAILDGSGFGLELVDVIGGLTRDGFQPKAVIVLSKGGREPVPPNILANAQAAWFAGFQEYCNTPERAPHTKTLAQFRAWRHARPAALA